MKEVLGVLLSSGYSLDQILDWSWDHINLTAECIMTHKVEMINMVFEPVAAAFGGKGKKKNRQKSIDSQRRLREAMTPQQKENDLLRSIGMAGLKVQGPTK